MINMVTWQMLFPGHGIMRQDDGLLQAGTDQYRTVQNSQQESVKDDEFPSDSYGRGENGGSC